MLYGEKKKLHMARNAFKGRNRKHTKALKRVEHKQMRAKERILLRKAMLNEDTDVYVADATKTWTVYSDHQGCYNSGFWTWVSNVNSELEPDARLCELVAVIPVTNKERIRRWVEGEEGYELNRARRSRPYSYSHKIVSDHEMIAVLKWLIECNLHSELNDYMLSVDGFFTREEHLLLHTLLRGPGDEQAYVQALHDRCNRGKMNKFWRQLQGQKNYPLDIFGRRFNPYFSDSPLRALKALTNEIHENKWDICKTKQRLIYLTGYNLRRR